MNLQTESWIPVQYRDGSIAKISLLEVFERLDNIIDIIDLRPIEKISVIRLLVACVQAGLDGPNTREELKMCKDSMAFKAIEYLKKWTHKFETNGQFLQQPNLTGKFSESGIEKLFIYAKSGSNKMVFVTFYDMTESEIALALLTYMNFSPCGLLGFGTGKWADKERSASGGPCSSVLVTMLIGKDLKDTIWLNMVSKEDLSTPFGKPSWEYNINSIDDPVIEEISSSYLSRLVPIPKFVLIQDNNIIMIKGIKYKSAESGIIDTMLTVLKSKKDTDYCLKMNPDVHPWRYLHTVVSGNSAPYILRKNIEMITENVTFISAGLCCDQGKIIDELEWNFEIPANILIPQNGNVDVFRFYRLCVDESNEIAQNLREATKKYFGIQKIRKSLSGQALAYYWNILNGRHEELLEICCQPNPVENWRKISLSASKESYDVFCPCVSSKLLEAYVKGKSCLNRKRKKVKNDGLSN